VFTSKQEERKQSELELIFADQIVVSMKTETEAGISHEQPGSEAWFMSASLDSQIPYSGFASL
jgi:hypothetical protein